MVMDDKCLVTLYHFYQMLAPIHHIQKFLLYHLELILLYILSW